MEFLSLIKYCQQQMRMKKKNNDDVSEYFALYFHCSCLKTTEETVATSWTVENNATLDDKKKNCHFSFVRAKVSEEFSIFIPPFIFQPFKFFFLQNMICIVAIIEAILRHVYIVCKLVIVSGIDIEIEVFASFAFCHCYSVILSK